MIVKVFRPIYSQLLNYEILLVFVYNFSSLKKEVHESNRLENNALASCIRAFRDQNLKEYFHNTTQALETTLKNMAKLIPICTCY